MIFIKIIEWYCRKLICKIVILLNKRDVLSNHTTSKGCYCFDNEIELINNRIIRLQKRIESWNNVIKEIKGN
jgi:hypothetical protein